MERVLNKFGMGRPMAVATLWSVCLICLAWAALWLRHSMGRVLNMCGMGRPMAAASLWSVCLICLAWAAQWLRLPSGACAEYVWHGPPYGCGRAMGRVLNMFGMGRPMAAVALWGVCLICLARAALWLSPLYGALA